MRQIAEDKLEQSEEVPEIVLDRRSSQTPSGSGEQETAGNASAGLIILDQMGFIQNYSLPFDLSQNGMFDD